MYRYIIEGQIFVEGIDQDTANSINEVISHDFGDSNIALKESDLFDDLFEIGAGDEYWMAALDVKEAIQATIERATIEGGRVLRETDKETHGVVIASSIGVMGSDHSVYDTDYEDFYIREDGSLGHRQATKTVFEEIAD